MKFSEELPFLEPAYSIENCPILTAYFPNICAVPVGFNVVSSKRAVHQSFGVTIPGLKKSSFLINDHPKLQIGHLIYRTVACIFSTHFCRHHLFLENSTLNVHSLFKKTNFPLRLALKIW